MITVKAAKKAKNSTAGVPVGKHKAKFTVFTFHPDYAYDEVILARYILTDDEGNKHRYEENFYNDDQNDRTVQFFDYCDDNGIPRLENGLPDLVGKCEEVVLKKRVGYKKPVIVERNFIDTDVCEGDADGLPSQES